MVETFKKGSLGSNVYFSLFIIFSFFLIIPLLSFAQEENSSSALEALRERFKDDITLSALREEFDVNSNSGVASNFLETYRTYFQSERQEREDLEIGNTDLRNELEKSRQAAMRDANLWDRIDRPKESGLRDHLLDNTSVNFSILGGAVSYSSNLSSLVSLFSENSEDDESSSYIRRHQQINISQRVVVENVDAMSEYERLRESHFDPESRRKWESEVRTEGGIVYFKDGNGKDRQFHLDFLTDLQNTPLGKRMIDFIRQSRSKSFEEVVEQFPDIAVPYLGFIQNEELQNQLKNLEEAHQNQGKIDEHIIEFADELIGKAVTTAQKEFRKELSKFLSPPTQPLNEQIETLSKEINSIEEQLRTPSLSSQKRDELQKEREEKTKSLGKAQNKQIEDLRRDLLLGIRVGTQAIGFLADIFGANPETKEAIRHLGNFAAGGVMVTTAILSLASVSPPLAAVSILVQGLSMIFSIFSSSGPDSTEVILESIRKNTEAILTSIAEHTQAVIEHQQELHRDLKGALYDFELRVSTDIKIVGLKIDAVQRFLYNLRDFLSQGFEEIQEDFEEVKRFIERQENETRALIWDFRNENFLLILGIKSLIKDSLIETALAQASGFDALFEYSNANHDMIACSKDYSQCTENAKHQMNDLRRTMGELAHHVGTTLRRDSLSPFIDIHHMQKTQISGYLSEEQQARVEDRIGLFYSLGEWLNSHFEEEDNQMSLDSMTYLSHPRLFPLLLDKYVELGLYLPQNIQDTFYEGGAPTRINEKMEFMCQETLKQKEAAQEMRKALPLAWKIYRGYLSQLKEVYSEWQERYKEEFVQVIRGEESSEGEGVEDYLDPLVSSPLFLEEDFTLKVKEVPDPSDPEGGGRIPKKIDVFLEDLLFLSEDKIKIFVENMEEEERSHLARQMGAYVYREERQRFETKICQSKKWEDVHNSEVTFPNGRGGEEKEESLTNDFWIPKSFEYSEYFEHSGRRQQYGNRSFDCESKGQGAHVIDFKKRHFTHKYNCNRLRFNCKTAHNTQGLRLNYSCKKRSRDIYDKYGNRYSGETWEIEAEVESYRRSDDPDVHYSNKVLKKRTLNCNACSDENEGRCTSNLVSRNFSSILFRSSSSKNLRFYCGWHKPRKREVCAGYKEGDILGRRGITDVSQLELPELPPELPEDISEEERDKFIKRRQDLIEEFHQELIPTLVEKLKDLRKFYLTQFQRHMYSYFSGQEVVHFDNETIAVPEEVQQLVKNFSLAKLALVSLIYGGFGRAVVEQNPIFDFSTFLKQLPSGYGPGMTLLKLTPDSSEAVPFSFGHVNSYAFRKWMFLMDHEFHIPEEITFPQDEDFILEMDGKEFDLSAFLGFGQPAFVYNLLYIAARNRNLMMSEECLQGLGFSFHSEVVKTQFPGLEDSSPEVRRDMALFVAEELNQEEEERKKGESLLSVLAWDLDPSVRLEAVSVAGQLENREGFEILRLLSRDSNPEVKLRVAQAARDLEGVEGVRILKILSRDSEIEVIRESVSFAQDRALALTGVEDGGLEEDSLLLITALSEMSAKGNEEALILLLTLFHSEHSKSIEDGLIELGLLKPERRMEEGENLYSLFKTLLRLASIGRREAIWLFDLFVQYREKDKGARKRMAYYVGELALEITKEMSLLILRSLFEDEEEEVRAAVAEAAGQIGGGESLQILRDLMRDEQALVRRSVAKGAGRRELEGEEGFSILRQLVYDRDKEVRRTVVEAAGQIEGGVADQVLRQFVSDSEREVRASVLGVLGERGRTLVLQILNLLSGDSDLEIRRLVLEQAVQRGGNIEEEVLNRLTSDKNLEIRRLVLEQAIQRGGDIEASVLRKFVFDIDLDIRKQVVEASARRNDEMGMSLLVLLMNDPHPDVRRSVVEAAIDISIEVGTQILDQLINDRDWQVRRSVAYALGEKNWGNSEKLFRHLVRDSHKKVRRSLARSAGKRGGELGIEILKALAVDEEEEVRSFVLMSAGQMENQEGADVLRMFKEESSLNVKESLIYAAIEMGGEAGLEILLPFLNQDYLILRDFIIWIGTIGGDEGSRLLLKLLSLCDLNTSDNREGKEICLSLVERIVESAQKIGGRVEDQFLRQFVKDDEIRMRMAVAHVAGKKALERQEFRDRILNHLVNDREWRVRESVAYAAGEIGGESGLQLLYQLTEDTHPRVRKSVILQAREMEDETKAQFLSQFINDVDLEIRALVAEMSSELEEGKRVEILRTFAFDDDPGVRVSVAYAAAIGEVKIQILNDLIEDESEKVREALARIAGWIGGEIGVRILMKLARDRDLDVRQSVVISAGNFAFETGLRILIPLLEVKGEVFRPEPSNEGEEKNQWILETLEKFLKHEEVKEFVALSIGSIGKIGGIQEHRLKHLFGSLVRDKDWRVRASLAHSIWEIEGDLAFWILNQLTEDLNPRVRVYVTQSAGILGEDLGFQILDRLVGDPNPDVRTSVARSTGNLKVLDRVQILTRLLYDEDSRVVVALTDTLGSIKREEGVQILDQLMGQIDLLSVQEVNVKTSFIQAAAKIGEEEGFHFLSQFINDESSSVRSFVAQSLGNMEELGGDFLLTQLAGDFSLEVKRSVIEVVLKREGGVRSQILHGMAEDSDSEVRIFLAQKLEEMEERERISILSRLSDDSHWKVRAFVHREALEIGGQVEREVLKAMRY